MLTPEQSKKNAEANAHISTDEIEQDISETEAEIATMKREAEHLAGTPLSMSNARMDHIRAEARISGIKRREEFIEKLKSILEYRKKHGT